VTALQILAALLTVTAAFSYLNHRWIRLPAAIGIMAISLGASLLMIAADRLGWLRASDLATRILERVALDHALLHGALGILLFAGALHIDLGELREQRLPVVMLAIGATVCSTFIVGLLAFLTLPWLGLPVPFGFCLLFGALISPTDPIAVLGILKGAGVPKGLEMQIVGESLFNDGVGVVIFASVLEVVTSHQPVSVAAVVQDFGREALGGAAFGLGSGYVAFRLLRSIDHYQTELLITLALVLGGYALAERVHVSAPIAAVVSGLVIGNPGRALGMSSLTRDTLDKFWSLADEVLNALLFVLVGFELVRLTISFAALAAGALMIPVVLIARLASVSGVVALLGRRCRFPPGAHRLLTWGGLRGGISVALALSIDDPRPMRDLLVTMTYIVVVFSILVQGLTLGGLARRSRPR
jgi:CPA1 family monovalent cation:H+ antiporter